MKCRFCGQEMEDSHFEKYPDSKFRYYCTKCLCYASEV